MFELMRAWILWFLMLISPQPQKHLEVQDARPNSTYYVGVVAAEAAYVTLLPSTPDKPKPAPAPGPIDPANCPTCKGLGKVRTGDLQGWTKCPTCKGGTGETAPTISDAAPTCTSGTCPLQSPSGAAQQGVPPSQTFRRR